MCGWYRAKRFDVVVGSTPTMYVLPLGTLKPPPPFLQ